MLLLSHFKVPWFLMEECAEGSAGTVSVEQGDLCDVDDNGNGGSWQRPCLRPGDLLGLLS